MLSADFETFKQSQAVSVLVYTFSNTITQQKQMIMPKASTWVEEPGALFPVYPIQLLTPATVPQPSGEGTTDNNWLFNSFLSGIQSVFQFEPSTASNSRVNIQY
jgi:hypothetical protein